MTLIKLVGSAYSDLMWAIWTFWKTAKLGSNKNLPKIQTLNSVRHVRLVPMNIKSKIKISWKSWFPSNKRTTSHTLKKYFCPVHAALSKPPLSTQNKPGKKQHREVTGFAEWISSDIAGCWILGEGGGKEEEGSCQLKHIFQDCHPEIERHALH